jgi:hypothetical protein
VVFWQPRAVFAPDCLNILVKKKAKINALFWAKKLFPYFAAKTTDEKNNRLPGVCGSGSGFLYETAGPGIY